MTKRSTGLRRRVELGVPAQRAFAAVGTLSGIKGWWTPLVSGSAKRGGTLVLRFRGLEETIRFRVESCVAPSSAQWMCLGHDSLEDWAGTRLTFTVSPETAETSSLELVHEGLVPSLSCYRACRAGWEHFIASLAAWAETGKGEPYGGSGTKQESDVGREDDAFSRLTARFSGDRRVTLPDKGSTRGRFGTNGLRVDEKIFAMWVAGALVVKLPRAEVDEAVAANHGSRLEMGKGRVMREWLVVDRPEHEWLELARRALRFVATT